MSWSDFGFGTSWSDACVYLLVASLIAYIIANRFATLRPYRRIIVLSCVVFSLIYLTRVGTTSSLAPRRHWATRTRGVESFVTKPHAHRVIASIVTSSPAGTSPMYS